MEEVLKQINTVTGTIGSMVCDDQGHLLAHVFPPLFDTSMLRDAVNALSENFSGLAEMTGGVKMTDFRYQNGRIVVKPVDGGCLVLLCESTINLQLLTISLNVAIKKLEKLLKTGSTTPISSAPPEKVSPASGIASAQELIEKGVLSAQLQGMQTALAKFLGPMAKIIFLECADKWVQIHQPVKAALPQLVDLVVKEIDDPAKGAEYRQRISHFL